MSTDNAHHQFELICLELVKQNILENVIPATGPVAGIGDQGRDFLSFKTHLGSNLGENSSFLGRNPSKELIVFKCSIQDNVLPKIKSDVVKIMDFGLPVEMIYFLSRENIRIGESNNLKKWALDTHEVKLEILDGNAITFLLTSEQNHWIATRYLNISKTFFNPTDHSREIQNFFNRINMFIESLKNNRFGVSDRILINTVKSLNQSRVKDEFGIVVSQTRKGADSTLEFLNGEYTLRIEMYLEGIRYGLYQGRRLIDLENPYDFYEFYESLQSYIELNTGIKIELPLGLIARVKKLGEVKNNFEELIRLMIQLYKIGDHNDFAAKIANSLKMRENIGIIIRNPNRQDGNIADEYFYFCEKKYYLIPNSRYLRKRNETEEYEDILTNSSSSDEINQKLTDLFHDLMTLLKKKYPNINLTPDEIDLNIN